MLSRLREQETIRCDHRNPREHSFPVAGKRESPYHEASISDTRTVVRKISPKQSGNAREAPISRDRTSPRRVALVGFGTVGRSVAKILCDNADGRLRLTHICNRKVERKKQPWVASDVLWTEDFQAVLNSDAEIVVELIGGLNPAEDLVRNALKSGKSVVTANKQLIARHGPDLLQLARANRCQLEFGASRGRWGFPVLPALRTGLSGDLLHGISGILNGTCNYILSRIETARIPSARRSKKRRLGATRKPTLQKISMAATPALSWRYWRSPDCRPMLLRKPCAPAPSAAWTLSTSITRPISAAPSGRFRVLI